MDTLPISRPRRRLCVGPRTRAHHFVRPGVCSPRRRRRRRRRPRTTALGQAPAGARDMSTVGVVDPPSTTSTATTSSTGPAPKIEPGREGSISSPSSTSGPEPEPFAAEHVTTQKRKGGRKPVSPLISWERAHQLGGDDVLMEASYARRLDLRHVRGAQATESTGAGRLSRAAHRGWVR